MEEFAVQARVGAHQPFTNRSAGESVNIEISGGKYFDNGSMVYGIDLSTVNPLRGTDREQLDDIYDEPVGYYPLWSWAGYLGTGYSGYAHYQLILVQQQLVKIQYENRFNAELWLGR